MEKDKQGGFMEGIKKEQIVGRVGETEHKQHMTQEDQEEAEK